MNGVMFTYQPGRSTPDAKPLDAAPTLEALQAGVGGDIEHVPMFDTIQDDGGATHKCVCFCNEEGKLDGLPVNNLATVLWDRALKRSGHHGLLQSNGRPADVLVGPIVVIIGDDELLEAL